MTTPPAGAASDGAALSREAVFELVARHLAEILAVPLERVTPAAELAGDLRADSLDLVEAVEAIEEELRSAGTARHVPEGVFADLKTVDDLVTAVWTAPAQGSP